VRLCKGQPKRLAAAQRLRLSISLGLRLCHWQPVTQRLCVPLWHAVRKPEYHGLWLREPQP
jgi:hypothetical protein